MGNTGASSKNNLIDARLKFQEKIVHSSYGEVTLMKDEENDDYIAIKELIFQNEAECQKEIAALKQQAKRKHDSLIKVINYKLLSENNLCSSVFKVAYMMEYFQRDLAFEIATRRIQKAPFHEGEIWFLLLSVVSGMEVLQSSYVNHGSLTTNNIFISKNGLVKIAEATIMKTLNNYAQALSGVRSKGIYLSPELMDCLREKNWSPCCDYFKSDVFTFGMILLEVCTLKTSDDIYNYHHCDFNSKLLEQRLDEVRRNVSKDLFKVLEVMLSIDLHRRMDFLQLQNLVGQNKPKNIDTQQSNLIMDLSIRSDCLVNTSNRGAILTTESENPTDIKKKPPNFEIRKASGSASKNLLAELDKENAQIEKGILLSGKREKKDGNFSPEPLPTFNYNLQSTSNKKLDVNINEVNFCYEGSVKQDSLMSPTFSRGLVPEIKELKLNTDNVNHTFNTQGKEVDPEETGDIQYCYYTKEQLETWKKHYTCLPEDENKQPKVPGVRNSFLNQSNEFGYKEGQSELVYIMNSFNFDNKPDQMFNQSSIFRHSKNPSANFSPTNFKSDKLLGALSPVKKKFETVTNEKEEDKLGEQHLQTQEKAEDQTKAGVNKIQIASLNEKAVKISDSSINFSKAKNDTAIFFEPEAWKENSSPMHLYQSAPLASDTFQCNYNSIPLTEIEKRLMKIDEKEAILKSETEIPSKLTLAYAIPRNSAFQSNLGMLSSSYALTNAGKTGKGSPENVSPNQKADDMELFCPNPLVLEILKEYRSKRIKKDLPPETNEIINTKVTDTVTLNKTDKLEGKNLAQIHLVYEHSKTQDLTLDTIPAAQNHSINSQSKFGYLSRVDSSEFRDQGNSQLASFNEYSQDLLKREHIHEVYEDGSVYEGEKMNELRHGRGKFYYADGGMYDGEWKNGRMHGYGHLYYPSGEVAYEGEWREDKFNGKGIVYNENPIELKLEFDYTSFQSLGDHWKKYEGDFKDDNKDGIGTIFLSNGDRFTGRFLNDEVHGQGTFFRRDGRVITGKWENNIIVYTY